MLFASQQCVLPSDPALYSRAATTIQNLNVKMPGNVCITHKYLLYEDMARCLHVPLATAWAVLGGEALITLCCASPGQALESPGISRLWDHLDHFAHAVVPLQPCQHCTIIAKELFPWVFLPVAPPHPCL